MSEIKSSPDLHRRVMGAPVARIVQKVDRVDSVLSTGSKKHKILILGFYVFLTGKKTLYLSE